MFLIFARFNDVRIPSLLFHLVWCGAASVLSCRSWLLIGPCFEKWPSLQKQQPFTARGFPHHLYRRFSFRPFVRSFWIRCAILVKSSIGFVFQAFRPILPTKTMPPFSDNYLLIMPLCNIPSVNYIFNGVDYVSSICSSSFGAFNSTLHLLFLKNQAGDPSLESLQGLDPENTDEQGKKMAPKNVEQLEEKASRTPENYHLRESLAWDSAFFTSDGRSDWNWKLLSCFVWFNWINFLWILGVLEPEELTSMIKNSEKKEMRTLPIILEETQRSTESISTLASDTLTLTSLEGELFEDIRASIQKSSKITNIQMFGSKAGQSSFGAYVHHCKSISTFSTLSILPHTLATYFY